MDTFDSSEPNVQARSFEASSLPREFSHAPAPRIGPRSLVRGLAAQWRQILFLWLAASIFLAYLIYVFVGPAFEAVSLLRIEPTQPELFGPGGLGRSIADQTSIQPYLQTQVEIIKSDSVLVNAITNPRLVNLPRIKASDDPVADLRDGLMVDIVANTWLIRVAIEARDPSEAATIVNAVVEAYLRQHGEYHRNSNQALRKSLETELAQLNAGIQYKTSASGHLTQRVEVARPRLNAGATAKDARAILQPALGSVTVEQYDRLADRLIQADLELIDAQARLDAAKLARERSREIPASVSAAKLPELEAAVEEAKRKKAGYSQYIAELKIESRSANVGTFEKTVMDRDLAHLQKRREIIQQKLTQLEFEIGQDNYRVSRHDRARVPKTASQIRRLKTMAVAPYAALFLVLGLFLLREIQVRGGADSASSGPPV